MSETTPPPTASTRSDEPIRVLVADDHPAVRSGLVALLDSAAEVTVVAEAADGATALELARRHRPDVVLTDVRMPGATGIEIAPRLRETGANVLVISGFDLDEYVLGALAAGADGYLVKSEDPARILAAVRAVHRGDAVLSPAATRAVVSALHGGAPPTPAGTSTPGGTSTPAGTSAPGGAPGPSDAPAIPGRSARPASTPPTGPAGPDPAPALIPSFTRREEEVLALLAQGQSNQQIAAQLFVEITTVKSHISHVLTKLGVDSRVQAALWWQQHRG